MNEQNPQYSIKNLGWRVTLAGMGINLALGILYTWSVFSKAIPAEWNWTETHKSLPYMFACLIFSLVMVPAGRMQDKLSPKLAAAIGGILVGVGFIVASRTTSPLGYLIGFGVLAGAGIGFGYASATPPAVKWFPKAKTGMIAGIVVSGFGLASVYTAPLSKWLISEYTIQTAMLILGIAFFVIVVVLAQMLTPPPAGYSAEKNSSSSGVSADPTKKEHFTPGEMLSTAQFYMMWFMYACGAGAGLMVIAKLAAIAEIQAGIKLGFLLVAALAIGNGAGRILLGMLSDKIGRKATLFLCFVIQAAAIMLLSVTKQGTFLASVPILTVLSALIGANYGANLALFPSLTKDYYGLKNFGINYGLVFTAWGVGGFMLSYLAGRMYDIYKTFAIAYYGASILLILAAACVFFIKPPHRQISNPQ
ncbi:MAG TPA: OFA family MFS transporter [Anaerohalosphaeraceae bacterium]|nr:OFA family MFS transporter [Phycisphaerae bacterium]HOK95451.1 OFA family MFS transporter [Anaerohalosphaeraceae bacterium]HOM75745.1 OFA family MFS transporter [Anaerohalosphaeraceae bacterium]HPC64461.1 OFA family MFS transporter [Anaerohalosphaeraceae bacterium]HPO69707.1 OFA family MFS transporter [Anaerohalosphaeraceae bacterium]